MDISALGTSSRTNDENQSDNEESNRFVRVFNECSRSSSDNDGSRACGVQNQSGGSDASAARPSGRPLVSQSFDSGHFPAQQQKVSRQLVRNPSLSKKARSKVFNRTNSVPQLLPSVEAHKAKMAEEELLQRPSVTTFDAPQPQAVGNSAAAAAAAAANRQEDKLTGGRSATKREKKPSSNDGTIENLSHQMECRLLE